MSTIDYDTPQDEQKPDTKSEMHEKVQALWTRCLSDDTSSLEGVPSGVIRKVPLTFDEMFMMTSEDYEVVNQVIAKAAEIGYTVTREATGEVEPGADTKFARAIGALYIRVATPDGPKLRHIEMPESTDDKAEAEGDRASHD